MASVPGDEASVAAAVARHPTRFAGLFMVNPLAPDAEDRVRQGFTRHGLRCACLFPAMHRFSLDDECVTAVFQARRPTTDCAVFVHCGMLSVGVRRKLGLPSRFDVRFGEPAGRGTRRTGVPERPGGHPALRGRLAPRNADGGRSRREHPRRHLQLQRLDEVHARSRAWPTCSVRRWPSWVPSASCSDPTRRSSRAGGSGRSTRRNAPRLSMRSASTRSGTGGDLRGQFRPRLRNRRDPGRRPVDASRVEKAPRRGGSAATDR